MTIPKTLTIRTPRLTPPFSGEFGAGGRRSVDRAVGHGDLVAQKRPEYAQAPKKQPPEAVLAKNISAVIMNELAHAHEDFPRIAAHSRSAVV